VTVVVAVAITIALKVEAPVAITVVVPGRVPYNSPMKPVSDQSVIATARKYRLDPSGLKCLVFALFDRGHSRNEVRYLLRSFREREYPHVFSNTIRRYHSLWRELQ
jgi:hypothetical protein